MQPLAIRILYVALIAVYGGVSSAVAVETKYPHGGFEPRLDKFQGLLGYIHTAKKIEVKAGPKLWKTIAAIPVAAGVPITPEQEADLRDWLYDFLVAFSASGSDSLAAQFYLREGVNNPRAIKNMQETLADWGVPNGDTPSDIFRAMHRAVLDDQGYEYRFGKAFLRHSTFKVFEMQGHYESYHIYPREAVSRATTRARTRGKLSRPDSNCSKKLTGCCGMARNGSSPTSRLPPKSRRSSPDRKDRFARPSFVG